MKYITMVSARLLFAAVLALGAGAVWQSASAQTDADPDPEADSELVENPIIRERFSSDPAALVHDGRVWLYTGHDEAGTDAGFFEMHDWQLYSSDDMIEWEHHGSPISVETFDWARGDAWASQVIERDGTLDGGDVLPGFSLNLSELFT